MTGKNKWIERGLQYLFEPHFIMDAGALNNPGRLVDVFFSESRAGVTEFGFPVDPEKKPPERLSYRPEIKDFNYPLDRRSSWGRYAWTILTKQLNFLRKNLRKRSS
ncbi:hypothetical cytosolic protein [Syntrophus aciditrophicus SB]|uniref:Hypothetical cytosolic protein n=1 Tax=Syntrophus aciditrophicus (strain SB) TaxID=56780 RepID=Q2LSP2_SYNAS|nr:hypothetical cytosolic protein [Syntrophus aciditrophicus SB]